MPYFNAKARRVFRDAKGNTEKAGPLAAWARDAHARAETDETVRKTGVVVARDGQILAHTKLHGKGDQATARYVHTVTHDDHRDIVGDEVGLAMGSLRRATGQDVLHVTYWQAASGQAETGRDDIHPERYLDLMIELNRDGTDGIVEYAGTGSDDDGEYLDLCDGTRLRRGSAGHWYAPGWSKYSDPDRAAYASVRRDMPSDNW